MCFLQDLCFCLQPQVLSAVPEQCGVAKYFAVKCWTALFERGEFGYKPRDPFDCDVIWLKFLIRDKKVLKHGSCANQICPWINWKLVKKVKFFLTLCLIVKNKITHRLPELVAVKAHLEKTCIVVSKRLNNVEIRLQTKIWVGNWIKVNGPLEWEKPKGLISG